MFRVISDTIEYDRIPIATILPSVWSTRRADIEMYLETYDPHKEDTLVSDLAEAQDRIKELELRVKELGNVE